MTSIDLTDPQTIAFLTDALTTAGVDGVEISGPSGTLRIIMSAEEKVSHAAPAPSPALSIKAPMAGIFCPPRPGSSEVPADLPRTVAAGQALGFLRLGPVLLPLAAPKAGLLTRQFVEAGALVGFGDTLFQIEPQS
ncbi:acetyl-CoA carboxylase [Rhizobium sp. FY34]|uniref:acetyl-CoA carboxylase n=1 Tax=Rhizobium sp. FY34 TaxID=2562309 RepID=UPI0010C0224B|nr:acetyl-CoA carboxylase [Rhizobium sp. FY34]